MLALGSSVLPARTVNADPSEPAYEAEAHPPPAFSAVAKRESWFVVVAGSDRANREGTVALAPSRTLPPDGSVRQASTTRSSDSLVTQRPASTDQEPSATTAESKTNLKQPLDSSVRDADERALEAGFEDDLDGALADGFDESASSSPSTTDAPTAEIGQPRSFPLEQEEPFWDLDGSFTFGAAYNYAQDSPQPGQADYRGLSRLRFGIDLELDLELPLGLSARVAGRGFRDSSYSLKDKDEFTHEVLQLYESELEFKEIWLQGSLGTSVDFRVGRQILAWGSSETLRVLDVLSPIDNREPGLTDLKDLRLPVTSTRISYFTGPFRLTGIAIHESRFNDTPPFGSDFFPFDRRPPGEVRPANGGSDTEYAVALTGSFARFDASLNWAQYFDDRPRVSRDSGLLEHSRLDLVGASVDVPLGNFLVRGEVARIRGLEFFATRKKLSRSDVLLGIEYSGFADKALTLEIVARRLNGYDDRLELLPDSVRENSFESSLRYTATYLNNRARLTMLFIVLGQRAQDGTTLRLTLDYDLGDAFTVGGGVLVFEEGDLPPFSTIDPNDRVFVNLRYSF